MTMLHAQRFERTNSGDSEVTAHYRAPLHELLTCARVFLDRFEYEVILAPAASDRAREYRAEIPACRGSSIRVSEQARIMT